MNNIILGLMGASVLALVVLSTVSAEEQSATGTRLGPGLRLESGFGTEMRYTDNMYFSPNNEVNGFGLLLTPAVALTYALPSSSYSLGYQGEWGEYDTSSEDDYQDSEVFFTGKIALFAKHRLELDARYKRGHDAFGTNRTQATLFSNQELDLWDRANAKFKYTFGSTDAALNVYVKGGVGSLNYRTNRTNILVPAAGTRFLDNDSESLGGGVVYRISPKTSLLFDIDHSQIDYETDSTPTFDGDLDRVLVGARWVATAKTTGEVWVGHFSRDFDDPARQDSSGADWKARVIWNPWVRTNLTLETGQDLRETYLLVGEDFINSQYISLDWRQDWAPRLYTNVNLDYAQDDYEGTTRSDDRYNLGTKLSYELSRSWTAKAGVSFGQRDSSTNAFDFDRNIVFVGIDGTF